MDGSRKNLSKDLSAKSNTKEESYVGRFSLFLSTDRSIVNHLNLSRFKTEKCPLETCGSKKRCPYYHSSSDRRRDAAESDYIPQICEFGINCLNKANCPFSHNKYELAYHPTRYRRKYCRHMLNPDSCKYGALCASAHHDGELKVGLLHCFDHNDDFFVFKYKTEFCPFVLEHNTDKCVYAHSWEDHKRDIMKTPYSKHSCPSWETNKRGTLEQRCKDGPGCKYSHSRFEIEFHPMNYKKLNCKEAMCRKFACGYLHLNESLRFREMEPREHFFMHPYNRVLPWTFANKESFFHKKSENII